MVLHLFVNKHRKHIFLNILFVHLLWRVDTKAALVKCHIEVRRKRNNYVAFSQGWLCLLQIQMNQVHILGSYLISITTLSLPLLQFFLSPPPSLSSSINKCHHHHHRKKSIVLGFTKLMTATMKFPSWSWIFHPFVSMWEPQVVKSLALVVCSIQV